MGSNPEFQKLIVVSHLYIDEYNHIKSTEEEPVSSSTYRKLRKLYKHIERMRNKIISFPIINLQPFDEFKKDNTLKCIYKLLYDHV